MTVLHFLREGLSGVPTTRKPDFPAGAKSEGRKGTP